ncbi:translation initiation factor IF-2 [Leptospira kirschneri serovar Mozdok]|uniref:Translation initiation factor IF-2 n=2 Tax=Leptospira kirschneri TaxID=29507 RepID=A0A828Y540_9LEPT|nr:translation initiation factor IF-2 [Leptospira kirschneri str. 200802841]EMN27678.1 translation initiation factor IF-2 [Leptospira kirschneri serovar Sokoine str. RM1]KON77269.1 Translation initiation factor IF-2 [Leptospira kirschneri serovar Mozdok]KPZ77466.1 translation initiation factor IF-2 [Leptospira kirschneri serovar Mozdok]NDK04536.1 Translation initiation factor IF-2 [Leptospira kirschneri serovar Mozdok]
MEDKNKTIKETLQGSADAGKRKKLIIKKKGDDPSTPSPAASPKKETVAESAPSQKPPVMPLPLPGNSGQSPIVRPAPSSHSPAKREESPSKQDTRPPRDKDTRQSGGPPSRSPFQKEDSNIIVSRPIQRTGSGPSRPNSGGGYQGNRGPGQGGGYQGNRGPGQGGGYQGNRGPGQGGGYQGNRGPGGGPGQGGGGYQGNRGPRSGGTGTRPMPITSAEVELSQSRGSSVTSKKKGHDKEKSTSDRDFSGAENTKFFKQKFKKTKVVGVSGISVPKEITVLENVQVGELAKKMNLKPGDVIGKLMKMGMMVTINNIIDAETAALLADEYGCKVKVVSLYEETIIEEEKDKEEDYINRPPVVTIMGHVDHGKTKLLDTIRRSSVIDTESGGITQHIGAYQVRTARGLITFLDTPGHEAFTSMRARGAKVTDIVVLVVAADDGVMPQTLEAISHAKAAEVPILVAINKIDLPAANPEKIMQELANHGLQSEEWGGETMYAKISARENIGIDKLLEMILLQAEVMDLKANPKRRAKGTIIEAKLDPGRGSVATVLIQNGTLRVGDPFVAGVFSGRVRAMYNDLGQLIQEAGPAFPAQVTGIDGVPDAGAPFDAMADEKEARNISQHRIEFERIGNAGAATGTSSKVTLENMNEFIKQGALKELKVIIKADVRGSAEAIKESLEKLSTPEVKLNVIQSGAGAIVDMDVMLASASNALIIGFHVRANPKTIALAEKEGVQIKYYNIIYQVVDEIKLAMEGLLEPEKIEEVIGTAEIREIFKVSKIGNIAGCMVLSGKIQKSANIRVIGDGATKFEGKLKSLKRVKDDVNDVVAGFECGIQVDGYNDFKVGDTIEAYNVTVIKRKLE